MQGKKWIQQGQVDLQWQFDIINNAWNNSHTRRIRKLSKFIITQPNYSTCKFPPKFNNLISLASCTLAWQSINFTIKPQTELTHSIFPESTIISCDTEGIAVHPQTQLSANDATQRKGKIAVWPWDQHHTELVSSAAHLHINIHCNYHLCMRFFKQLKIRHKWSSVCIYHSDHVHDNTYTNSLYSSTFSGLMVWAAKVNTEY